MTYFQYLGLKHCLLNALLSILGFLMYYKVFYLFSPVVYCYYICCFLYINFYLLILLNSLIC